MCKLVLIMVRLKVSALFLVVEVHMLIIQKRLRINTGRRTL